MATTTAPPAVAYGDEDKTWERVGIPVVSALGFVAIFAIVLLVGYCVMRKRNPWSKALKEVCYQSF